MSKSKTVIDFNEYQYNRMLDLESKITTVYEKILELGEEALGVDKCNMVELLKSNPAQYIVNEYAEMYLQDFPKHLDREHLFLQQTKVSLEVFTQLKLHLDDYMLRMGNHRPTINAKGITSNVKMKAFNIYLNESKEDYYNALNNLVDAIEELREYNGVSHTVHLVRAFPDLLMEGTSIKINVSKFI